MPKFSLVVATLGRDAELNRLFESLINQDYKDFEIVIVDQNKDDRVKVIAEKFKNDLNIRHIQVDFTGVSKSRDYGLKKAEGEIIAYPDDDCFYEKDVLSRVIKIFEEKKNLAIFSTGSYCILAPNKFSIGTNSPIPVSINKKRLMGIEFTVFYNMKVIKKEDLYLDLDFGMGSKYKSTEGIELLYRLLSQGYTGYYDPAAKIYHKKDYLLNTNTVVYRNAFGDGAFIRKYFNKGDFDTLYYIIRKMTVAPLLKVLCAILLLNKDNILKNFYYLKGIWSGFFAYKKEEEQDE